MTIDQLAEIQPGMAKIMQSVAHDFTYSYHAAKGGNWKLAAHEISLLRAEFRTAKVTRPKYAADLDAFDAECLVPILKAIQAKDWETCRDAFERAREGSDRYHDKLGFDYIRYLLPEVPPTDLQLGQAGMPPKGKAPEG